MGDREDATLVVRRKIAACTLQNARLQRVPVIWKRRRGGKAKRAHQSPRHGGHGAPKSGLPDFGTKDVSKSATADFDVRAFAHPTRDSMRSKFAIGSGIFVVERLGEVGKFGTGGDQRHQAKRAVRVQQPGNRRCVSGKMTRAGHKLDQALVELAEGRSIGCGEARNV